MCQEILKHQKLVYPLFNLENIVVDMWHVYFVQVGFD